MPENKRGRHIIMVFSINLQTTCDFNQSDQKEPTRDGVYVNIQ